MKFFTLINRVSQITTCADLEVYAGSAAWDTI